MDCVRTTPSSSTASTRLDSPAEGGLERVFCLTTLGRPRGVPSLGAFGESLVFNADGSPRQWTLLRKRGGAFRAIATGAGAPPWNSSGLPADLIADVLGDAPAADVWRRDTVFEETVPSSEVSLIAYENRPLARELIERLRGHASQRADRFTAWLAELLPAAEKRLSCSGAISIESSVLH
jgi:hypothetical protein